MEYVNSHSLRMDYETPLEIRRALLEKFDPLVPPDYIIATDKLELLRGEDLLESAQREGKQILPFYRASYIKKTHNFPKRIILELTSRCNAACSMCPRNVFVRDHIHMDMDLAEKIIREAAGVGISGLWLFYLGEPFLHPDFFEILKICRQYDSLGTIWASTNGQIMKENMRGKVMDNPLDILNYSVNSMSKENFRRVSPTLNFESVQQNIKELWNLRKATKKTRPLIRAQMLELPYVLDEIEEFKRVYGMYADILSINRLEEFSQEMRSNSPRQERIINTLIPRCNRLERQDFLVMSNGSVTCCDTDFNCRFNLGNVREQTIGEIFEGDRYRNLLRQYREGRLHEQAVCATCRDFNL